ncbi:MAG: DUF362 domain-containing protein [Candidatus Woesearchaeota archaeon]
MVLRNVVGIYSVTPDTIRSKIHQPFEDLEIGSLSGKRVVIKPNIVGPFPDGYITPKAAIRATIDYLRERNESLQIIIAEAPPMDINFGEVVKATGIDKLVEEYGGDVELIDVKNPRLEREEFEFKYHDSGYIEIWEGFIDPDTFFISMPTIKTHIQTLLTMASKNLKGCIESTYQKGFHMSGLHDAIKALNKNCKA